MDATLAGRLTAFRLNEIPLELRLRAAATVARSTHRAPPTSDVKAEDLLFARLRDLRERNIDALDASELRKVAERPSDRVYWIPTTAWERIMLPKNRRTP